MRDAVKPWARVRECSQRTRRAWRCDRRYGRLIEEAQVLLPDFRKVVGTHLLGILCRFVKAHHERSHYVPVPIRHIDVRTLGEVDHREWNVEVIGDRSRRLRRPRAIPVWIAQYLDACTWCHIVAEGPHDTTVACAYTLDRRVRLAPPPPEARQWRSCEVSLTWASTLSLARQDTASVALRYAGTNRQHGGTVVLASTGAFGLLGLIVVLGLYFLPTIVAVSRKVTHQGSVAVINVFLGWTLIGWVVALAMACRTNAG